MASRRQLFEWWVLGIAVLLAGCGNSIEADSALTSDEEVGSVNADDNSALAALPCQVTPSSVAIGNQYDIAVYGASAGQWLQLAITEGTTQSTVRTYADASGAVDVTRTAQTVGDGQVQVQRRRRGRWETRGTCTFAVVAAPSPPPPAAPVLTYSPSSLDFGSINVGSVSAVKTLTVTNSGSSDLIISDTVLSGDFQWGARITTTCVLGSSNAPGSTCTMAVSFAPQSAANLTGTLTVTSNAPNSPQVISLTGSGASAPTPPPPTSGATLLFRSGFEGNVSLGTPYSCSTTCWQDIKGTDTSTGFSWPISVWNPVTSAMQVLADTPVTSTTVGTYIKNEIQTVVGHSGTSTRALYTGLEQASGGSALQDPYILSPGAEGPGLYATYYLKFQSDLAQRMGPNQWRTFFEWKTSGDYRVIVYVLTDSSGKPYWYIAGDNEANGGLPYQEFWHHGNTTIPVPVGEWFKVEVYWERSASSGRVWFAANGQTVFDHYGPLNGINNKPINRIMLFQTYAGGSKPTYQWVDDVEIWDRIPH